MIAVRDFTAGCLLASGSIAFASPVLSQEGSAVAGWTQFGTSDGSATISMPCAEPRVLVLANDGEDGLLCQFEGAAYLLVLAVGDLAVRGSPFYSNFDSAAEDIRTARQTDMFHESQIDGRRAIVATTDESYTFGMMKAIELASAKVVYAVVMETESRFPDEDDHHLTRADEFIGSLQVVN